jgi:hypothetical protein
MRELWRAARDARADGVIAFNVLANTSVNLCDYAAELGWNPDLSPHEHLASYARRRYDRGPAEQMVRAYIRMDDCLVPDLTLPGAPTSVESQLAACQAEGTISDEWVRERRAKVSEWLEIACSARSLAVAAVPDGDAAEVPQRFLRETVYIEWRCLGILALLRAHRAKSPVEAAELVVEAVDRLRALAERYEYPDLAMSALRARAKERGLHYTGWFLEDWRRVGASVEKFARKGRLIPARENFPCYEQAILDAAPPRARESAAALLEARDAAHAELKVRS